MSAGTSRMAKNHVIVRRLNALEALGGVTWVLLVESEGIRPDIFYSDICSDKTGTLTQGRMVVHKAWIPSASGPERKFTVETSSEALRPEGRVFEDLSGGGQVFVDPSVVDENLDEMIHVASMCNVAT